ncbi:GntR family transcriptional regulator [Rhizobium sp. HT1-10]|uniref:GntR family transcriptional regulator n=1 Tax=Rhizobium sp. HT1-10 TaxID=3111638 RepID=UPI003C2161FF
MTLVRNSPVSLYQQIADQLRADIARGEFDPAGRLPSEAEMGAKFGVSRVTVRLAFDDLEREGLIERRKGKGTFVAGKQVRHRIDTLRSFHETLKMQGLEAKMQVIDLRAIETPEALQLHFGKRCSLLERLHIVSNDPIAVGRSFLPIGISEIAKKDIEKRPTYALIEDYAGRPIVNAEIAIGARATDRRIGSLVQANSGAILLVMERNSYFADGACAESSEFFIRPERYKFVLSNHN